MKPLGFDTEALLDGTLVCATASDGRLAVDADAVGLWVLGKGPWPGIDPSAQPRTTWAALRRLREGDGSLSPTSGASSLPPLTADDVLSVQNAPYDLASFPDGERTPARLVDSFGLSWLDQENPPHDLGALTSRRLKRSLWKPITVERTRQDNPKAKTYRSTSQWIDSRDNAERVMFDRTPIEHAPFGEVADYCVEDSRATADLSEHYMASLPPELVRWWWDVEEPHLRSCIAMSRQGVPIDVEALPGATAEARAQLARAEDTLEGLIGWRVNAQSPTQINALLYDERLTVKVRQLEGHYSTGRERWRWRDVEHPGLALEPPDDLEFDTRAATLEALGHPVASAVLDVREWAKLVGTYLEPMAASVDSCGRLHPRCKPWGTVTGRVSMSGPNLQTLPARKPSGALVKALVRAPRDHRLVIADYSQLEFRILAWYVGMKVEGDVHQAFADLLGCTRAQAKTYEYGAIYGAGPAKLAAVLGCSEAEARRGMDGFWAKLPAVKAWKSEVEAQAHEEGLVTLPSGRRRHLDDAMQDRGPKAKAALRQAVNVKCQGAAADVMRCAVASLWRDGVVPVLQVHDSVVLVVHKHDAHDAAEHLNKRMVAAGERAGVGASLATDIKILRRWE